MSRGMMRVLTTFASSHRGRPRRRLFRLQQPPRTAGIVAEVAAQLTGRL